MRNQGRAPHRFQPHRSGARRLPAGAANDARWLVVTRALRALADGAVSILLVTYLQGIGFTAFQVGAIVTGTLLGSAALTLVVGLAPHGLHPLRLLKAAAVLMFATGTRLCDHTVVLAVVRGRRDWDAQSLGGRRQRIPPDGAGAARGDGLRQRSDAGVRLVQRMRNPHWRRWGVA